MTLRLLRLIHTVDPRYGGPIEGVFRQTELLSRMGVSTRVATLDSPEDPWVADSPIDVVPLGLPGSPWRKLKRVFPWVRYEYTPHFVPWMRAHLGDFDVVIVHNLWSYNALAARRTLVGSNTPYVVFTHGALDPWLRATFLRHQAKQLFWMFSEGPLLNNAREVLFTSEEEKRLAEGAFRPYNVRGRVISYGTGDPPAPTAAQEAAFRSRVSTLGDRKYILFLSRFHPKKGCELLLRAFARQAAQMPGTDLVMAGPDQLGWQKTLSKLVSELGIGERVHWPGMLTGDAKWGAFHGTEAFILPSHTENFGIVVTEAMSCNKPVLISNKVNIWREIEASGAGLIEPDTLAGTERLLTRFGAMSEAEREAMGQNAGECFRRHFHIQKVASELFYVLKGAAASGKANSP